MHNTVRKLGQHTTERGATLILVAAGLVMVLGLGALAIDLASFYVVRSEAQRSADAAALAGATVFASGGCTTGPSGCSNLQSGATNDAIAVRNKNLVGGQNPNIQAADISFQFTPAEDPRITV